MGPQETPTTTGELAPSARTRILDTAYELFSHNGLRAVGIERIIDESGVAKKTLYRHFPSKVDLILAFLDAREQRWTRDWLLALAAEAEHAAPNLPCDLAEHHDHYAHGSSP